MENIFGNKLTLKALNDSKQQHLCTFKVPDYYALCLWSNK